ncbi:MAG: hypothetical protein ACRCZO_20245, partial [Cetobacterium sp.]
VSGSELDSDNNALPSNQEAFKNEGGSSVCQSKDLMLGQLHVENELLRQQVNRLQSSVELLSKNQDTLINERRKDSAIIGLILKNQNTAADHRRRDRQENELFNRFMTNELQGQRVGLKEAIALQIRHGSIQQLLRTDQELSVELMKQMVEKLIPRIGKF